MTDISREDFARAFTERLPHARAIGLVVEEIAEGRARAWIPYDPRLVGDPETGVMAGGTVFTLLDTTCGAAVVGHPLSGGVTATLDLRLDYMRAATPGQRIRARAECYHVTRSVAFVRALALDDDEETPVAAASGAFTFTPRAEQEAEA
ncbi:PaaI family thioesterase [Pseudooceanicola sp. CBS1P-1]|uniref:Hotdog fold thioesterase n=1 Tax=Pseudooceanicola albus TaxID=2692189 RepID=A0A6L7G173_9RHOB|nr:MULTISPECIES: PaaI family thioesterase [Pseudooceanicola]MBT9382596.1 PaaI family thioesterase [Pseudooceanicola endophyticus]MXN17137.1 hotdog fold thioesterase [Pseudooceanicola albus]